MVATVVLATSSADTALDAFQEYTFWCKKYEDGKRDQFYWKHLLIGLLQINMRYSQLVEVLWKECGFSGMYFC